ncbi:MAG: outer membrane lipoprotein-sorting protein [Hyphomicrobiales bacterium]|nr:outer membrane lipoprotein-sorting protein [Hyphomicrobiales bacterium]MCP5373303.1 outer membrane lipoprotein-sorting protein [Hyphomicrobiales bacterium]
MTKRLIAAALVLAAAVPTFALAETPEEKGLRIAKEADVSDAGFADFTANGKMILRNKQGKESTREFKGWTLEVSDDGDKSMNMFTEPRDVKGTALLTWNHKQGDDDQWLYLPVLKRVKRISSSNKTGSYVGSEFSYEDLTSPEVEKYTYKWLREEPCPVKPELTCNVMERYPTDKESGYSKQIAWLEKETYRGYKVDYYDRKDTFLKTLTFHDYNKYADKHWRPGKMMMVNHQTGKSTDMLWTDYQFKTGLSDGDFKSTRLKNLR